MVKDTRSKDGFLVSKGDQIKKKSNFLKEIIKKITSRQLLKRIERI